MENPVKHRLMTFISYKGLTNQRFEKLTGLSNGYVNNIRSSISPKKLEEISMVFPDLNPVWLLLGKGSMLRTETDNIPIIELKKPAPDTSGIPVFGFSEQKQRLVTYINAKGLTKHQFENMAGLPNAYVAGIRQGITGKKLTQIKAAFPDLNPAWLMTGEGSMLRTGADNKAIVDVKTSPTPPPAIVPIPGINTHTRNKKEEPAETDELLRQIVKQNTLLLNQYSQLQSQMQQTLTLLARVLSNSTNPHNPINYKAAEAEDE